MKKTRNFTFSDFVERFPEVDLPVNLTSESIFAIDKENLPLPEEMILAFLGEIEAHDFDEFTEYIPCFRLKETHQFTAVVYWKAQLLQYQYILATFDQKNEFIKSAVIAGTQTDGDEILQSVAHIDEDWVIQILEGKSKIESEQYDPNQSKSYNMEILATGEIIFLLNDEFV